MEGGAQGWQIWRKTGILPYETDNHYYQARVMINETPGFTQPGACFINSITDWT